MGILLDLVTKLQDFQETTNSEPATENSQEGSDLFLESNQSSTVEANKEQVGKEFSFYSNFSLMECFFYLFELWVIIMSLIITSIILLFLELLILIRHPLCLDPSFCAWLHLQAPMFGAVVSGSGAGRFASSRSEPHQTKAPVCSAEWWHPGFAEDQYPHSPWSGLPGAYF